MRFALSLSLVLVLLASPAWAWNAYGHKVIASIAFRRLSPAEQDQVIAILKQHPRYAEDFAGQMPAAIAAAEPCEQTEWLFQHAAAWPEPPRGLPGPLSEQYHPG